MQNEEERSPPEVPQEQTQQSIPPPTTTGTMAAVTTTAVTAVSNPSPTIRNIAEPDRAGAMDLDNNNNNGTKSTTTPEERARENSVLSIDDIEAAQALEGLRSGKLLTL